MRIALFILAFNFILLNKMLRKISDNKFLVVKSIFIFSQIYFYLYMISLRKKSYTQHHTFYYIMLLSSILILFLPEYISDSLSIILMYAFTLYYALNYNRIIDGHSLPIGTRKDLNINIFVCFLYFVFLLMTMSNPPLVIFVPI